MRMCGIRPLPSRTLLGRVTLSFSHFLGCDDLDSPGLARWLPHCTVTARPVLCSQLDTYARGHGGVQTWLCIDRTGNMVTVQMNKLATSRRMGVPLRDLRVLDPKLSGSYASAILCRERAMVVNLEQIKCIIGLDEVFVLDFGNVDVVPFVEQLERKLRAAHLAAAADDKTQARGGAGGGREPSTACGRRRLLCACIA